MRVELRQIEGGKTGIEMKVWLQEVTGLAITQSRKLLGILEEKFNPESQFIELRDVQLMIWHKKHPARVCETIQVS